MMTPTSGTLPTPHVSPALAGPPPGTLPAVSSETANAAADPWAVINETTTLPAPPLESPIAFTDPRTANTPLFPEGSPFGNKSQAVPLNGFWNTFAPTAARANSFKEFQAGLFQDLVRNVQTNSAAAGLAKFLAGNTDAEQAQRRKALGMDRDPIEDDLNQYAEQAYQQGGYDSPDYKKIDQALTAYRAARENPTFQWKDLVAAHQADPGAFWGEAARALAADPEFFTVPVGWVKAAGAAEAAAKAAGAGAGLAKAAGVVAGATGAAATGAAITAPVSAAQQLGETGTVDFPRLFRETAMSAGASAALPALIFGAPASIRALRALRGRPGIDAAAVDAEIGQTISAAEQAAEKAGMDSAAVRSELTRIVETPEGRGVVQPRTEVLDQLPGVKEPAAMPATPTGEVVPGVDLRARAEATPRDDIGLEIAATEVGDPVTVKTESGAERGVITAKTPDDSPVSPYRYTVKLADGTELADVRHDAVHPTPELIAARHALDAELYPIKGGAEGAAGGEIVPPRASPAAEIPEPASKPDLTARIAEYDRLAGQTTDAEVRALLARQAEILRAESAGRAPKLTARERIERARRVDTSRDDLSTAIRKLGGIDTTIETDFAGRLSHLPRGGFGLPALERPGKGETLDGLAEALHERGYLTSRDVAELYNKLDRVALGEKLYSYHADPQLVRGEEPFRPRSTDADWVHADTGQARAGHGDYIIDDHGAVVPSRAMTHDDWLNLEKEMQNAERWYQLESGESPGHAGGNSRDGVPERLGDTVQRRSDQPRTGETAGLPGVEPRNETRQRLADRQREIDARLRGTQDIAPGAGEGDLFSGKAKQTDIEDVTGKPPSGTLYSNPFLLGLRDTARDIGLHAGRNLAAAGAGGIGGATLSDAEPGSAQWWLDVAAGAAVATAGAQLLRRVNLLGKGSIADNALAHIGGWIDNLPLLGRGPEELRDLKGKQRLMKDLLDRQAAETGKQLLERFAPAERSMMADLIETRGIIKDLNVIHRQAAALDDYLTHATRRMKDLGMLPADMAEGGYLHRYYAKHLGLDRLFKEAKGQSLSGSWSMARGTDDVFERQYFSPGAKKIVNEFEQVAQDITRLERRPADLLSGDTGQRLTALKARKRELGKIAMHEFLGQQDGRLRSFLFTPDEVGRVDTGVSPVLADTTRTPGARAGDLELPTAPGVSDLKRTNYVWSVRGVKPKEALLHRDWTKYERKSWGEIDDAGYRYVRGMSEVSHDISLATLFKTVANKGDWVSAEPKITNGKPWVFVPDQRVGKSSPLKKYGALAGQYVRPDIWNGIRGYGRNALRGGPKIPLTGTGMGDAYLAALNKWKLYHTVYNPVTHFNNTYSNVEMLYMGGYSPMSIGAGVKHMAEGEKSAMWTEARDAGLFGTDWTTSLLKHDGGGSQALADLAEKLRTQPEIPDAELVTSLVMDLKKWWIDSKQAVAQADSAWKSGAAIAKAMAAPVIGGVKFSLKPVKAAGRASQRAYQFEDNLFKMSVYAAERGRGATPEAAVKSANDLFFNFQDVPEAIKLARDLPVGSPFITYTYKAVPAIAKNIVQNPEKVLFLAAAYEGLNYAVLTADGMSPGQYWATESADDETSPPWDRGRALWGARNTVHMPSPEGYKLALGRAHALGNPFMNEAGGREKLPNVPGGGGFWGSSVFGGNPLHALLDAAVNEDWKGKEIYKPGAPADEKAQKIAAYLYQAWAPSNITTPGGYQQTRVLEGMANDVRTARKAGQDPGVIAPVVDAANRTSNALGFGQFTGLDRADNEIVTRDALLASFGVKLRPVHVEQSVDFATSQTEQEKKKAAAWYQSKVREHTDGRITDAQMEQADHAFDAALDRLDTAQGKLFDAEAFLKKRIKSPKP
jgi:hypothetical protein